MILRWRPISKAQSKAKPDWPIFWTLKKISMNVLILRMIHNVLLDLMFAICFAGKHSELLNNPFDCIATSSSYKILGQQERYPHKISRIIDSHFGFPSVCPLRLVLLGERNKNNHTRHLAQQIWPRKSKQNSHLSISPISTSLRFLCYF